MGRRRCFEAAHGERDGSRVSGRTVRKGPSDQRIRPRPRARAGPGRRGAAGERLRPRADPAARVPVPALRPRPALRRRAGVRGPAPRAPDLGAGAIVRPAQRGDRPVLGDEIDASARVREPLLHRGALPRRDRLPALGADLSSSGLAPGPHRHRRLDRRGAAHPHRLPARAAAVPAPDAAERVARRHRRGLRPLALRPARHGRQPVRRHAQPAHRLVDPGGVGRDHYPARPGPLARDPAPGDHDPGRGRHRQPLLGRRHHGRRAGRHRRAAHPSRGPGPAPAVGRHAAPARPQVRPGTRHRAVRWCCIRTGARRGGPCPGRRRRTSSRGRSSRPFRAAR